MVSQFISPTEYLWIDNTIKANQKHKDFQSAICTKWRGIMKFLPDKKGRKTITVTEQSSKKIKIFIQTYIP